jgi:hypothetical protein
MASDEAAAGSDASDRIEVVVLEARAVDEMVGKIREAAKADGAGDAVSAWRDEHGDEAMREQGHDHAVVNQTLMYLHDAPDGMLVPHARYPDGREKVYTDADHAESAF